MSRIDDTIDVHVPVRTAYNQWTQFEEFPRFMEGVDRVVQLDDAALEWTATIAGQTRHWRARIVDRVPDQRIAWVSTSGARNDGIVTFRSLDADRTRINLAIEYEPEGAVENLGDALGVVEGRVKGDLERFRDFVEQRAVETGAWRGAIPDDITGDISAQPAPGHPGLAAASIASRTSLDEEATGRGFAEGMASPELTRNEPGAVVGSTRSPDGSWPAIRSAPLPEGDGAPRTPRPDVDEEATGRGFAEGQADPDVTRRTRRTRTEGPGFATGKAEPGMYPDAAQANEAAIPDPLLRGPAR